MNSRELYESLVKEVKGELNFKEIQGLKNLKKGNNILLLKKIKKLERRKKMERVMIMFVLILFVILAFVLQTDFLKSFHRQIVMILPFFAIALSPMLFSEKSNATTIKNLFIFDIILKLTEEPAQED